MRGRILFILIIVIFFGCSQRNMDNIPEEPFRKNMVEEVKAMKIISPSFKDNELIPIKHTCSGEDVSPELNFLDIPKNSKSLALIVDDPDAPSGNFVHWVVWNIPPEIKNFGEGIKIGTEGKTSYGTNGYRGPCPPPGKAHRYFFKLYALDTTLNLFESTNKSELEKAMEGHIIAESQIVGIFMR